MSQPDELTLGARWSRDGGKVTPPPIRVPVDGNKLACTIAIAGKGQSVPQPFLTCGAELPATIGNSVTPIREGQVSTTPTIVAVYPDGRHVPLAAFRVSGWERDLRYQGDPLFELDLRVVHRKDDDGTVSGWMELVFSAYSSDERLSVESIDPSAAAGTSYSGIVRSDAFVPVADVLLIEGDREARCHVRKREHFDLVLEDGAVLRVDSASVTLEEVDTIRTRGRWEEARRAFGAFLVYPEVELAERDQSTRFSVAERVVCAGDRVVVMGYPVVAPTDSAYRSADGAIRELVARDLRVEDPVPRTRAALSPRERERYRVENPPAVPKRRSVLEEMEQRQAEQRVQEEKSRRSGRWILAVTIALAIAIVGTRFAFLAAGETNGFTRFFDALADSD